MKKFLIFIFILLGFSILTSDFYNDSLLINPFETMIEAGLSAIAILVIGGIITILAFLGFLLIVGFGVFIGLFVLTIISIVLLAMLPALLPIIIPIALLVFFFMRPNKKKEAL